MGYNSSINTGVIKSDLSPEEINDKYSQLAAAISKHEYTAIQKILGERAYNRPKMDIYWGYDEHTFVGEKMEDGSYEIWMGEDDDCNYGKHYYHDVTAAFVASICTEKTHIEYIGEDGDRWGYVIYPGKAIVAKYLMTETDIVHNTNSRVPHEATDEE
jgi:hypothetical protein